MTHKVSTSRSGGLSFAKASRRAEVLILDSSASTMPSAMSAETIVVMDRGRIVEQGNHDELLRTCETYQQLYERQLFKPVTPAA